MLFNRSYIEIQNITEGNLFKQNGSETLFSSGLINNTEGTLINVWGLVITPGINVTTKGTFATISIYAKKKGTTKLNLTNVIISDPFSNSIQTNIINGSLEISDTTKHVASIRNLKNASYAQYYINWSWTDPADTDLSKVMVYINGKFRSNVSRGIQYYNSTGLIPGSMYTISTRTVDIAGNINKTWVNLSAGTKPDPVYPASVRNLKNSSYAQYYINWSWTDPADTDLSKVMVYINGKFRSNVSRGIQYYNSTGLIPGSMYTISTRTVDIAGNINKTWVNHSALTMP